MTTAEESCSELTTTVIAPNLQISKTVTPTIATPGQAITYTLTFSNSGNFTATGVVITADATVGIARLCNRNQEVR